ncbi:S1 RNA-binding domain-containing protein [Kamptonema animale CS-326]|uniref:S1 RNA-binding domain-containing protein n=1 Tax=Kamptonema animale TaxID=92934 RepID=UPI002330A2A5|nr:S1 RNA-binding domain-containing protein [Kamptonema animale]MDB9510116.1 S1 RNA-binding domain-containing protein [Kamptonema animale CS-326]
MTDKNNHANLILDAGIISKKYQQRALVKPDSLVNSKSNSFSLGEIVIGTVFKLEPEGALIDLGSDIAAYIPLREMSIVEVESPEQVLQLNETRQFLVVHDYDQGGNTMLSLSIRGLEWRVAWERLRQMQAENVTVYATVYATNVHATHRSGALVNIEGLRGLIPSSYISIRKPIEDLVGEELPLKFLEVNEDRDTLVLSHRRALLEPKIKELKVGDVVVGWIRARKPYGAFVDIGAIVALLHISEISHAPFDDAHSVFQVNDEVKAMIVDVDALRGRVSLSTKQLEPEPGDMLKNPQLVYEKAEEMAAKYRQQMQERQMDSV